MKIKQIKGMNALTDPNFAKPVNKGITKEMWVNRNKLKKLGE